MYEMPKVRTTDVGRAYGRWCGLTARGRTATSYACVFIQNISNVTEKTQEQTADPMKLTLSLPPLERV